MITDLNRVLFTLSAVFQLWSGYDNPVQAFELKPINLPYGNVHRAHGYITADDSTYKIALIDLMPYYWRAWGVLDQDDNLVSVYQLSSHMNQTCIYKDWAILDGTRDEIFVYDGRSTNTHEPISVSLGEDEHFQMMMERNIPDYNTMLKIFDYIKSTLPVLRTHEFVNPMSFEYIDLDFSGIKFKDSVLKMIEENSDFDFIDTMNRKPNQRFSSLLKAKSKYENWW